jgi:hypothetical protein
MEINKELIYEVAKFRAAEDMVESTMDCAWSSLVDYVQDNGISGDQLIDVLEESGYSAERVEKLTRNIIKDSEGWTSRPKTDPVVAIGKGLYSVAQHALNTTTDFTEDKFIEMARDQFAEARNFHEREQASKETP